MARQNMSVCYELHFTTEWGKSRQYLGSTKVRSGQTKKRAAELRLKHHLERPLGCMEGSVASSFIIKPVGRLMCQRNILLQEAIHIAFALDLDGTVRGACYSCATLGAFLRNSAAQVRKIVGTHQGQAARDALMAYAESLHLQHALRKHIAGKKYLEEATQHITLPTRYRSRVGNSGQPGKRGCQTHKRQLERGDYHKGDERHARVKRGITLGAGC